MRRRERLRPSIALCPGYFDQSGHQCIERHLSHGAGFSCLADATLAQFYSDNLAQETKKGKAERKAQGLYTGFISFGMMKGDDGVPITDPATFPGLCRAYELGAQGLSDRAIAQALNAAGYRTRGTHGSNPFTKDTVRAMLLNRFYLGELPGERPSSAAPVRHRAVINADLWEAARAMRERRATQGRVTIPRSATVYSLSGMAVCGYCGSHLRWASVARPLAPCANSPGSLPGSTIYLWVPWRRLRGRTRCQRKRQQRCEANWTSSCPILMCFVASSHACSALAWE